MKVYISSLLLAMTVILHSSELSLQFDSFPNAAATPSVLRSDSSSFRASDEQHPSARLHSPLRSLSPVQRCKRVRSLSPPESDIKLPAKLPSSDGLGYELDQLPFIRLSPTRNPNRRLRLQRYTFPEDRQIKVFAKPHIFSPVPAHEHIVLSRFDGDAYAILSSHDTLEGIYAYNPHNQGYRRTKINTQSGKVTILTPDEILETPVGTFRPIQCNFRVENVNHRDGSPSSSKPVLPAFPFSDVLGYELDQLQSIQLISKKNPNRYFEVQRYTFPGDKPIRILAGRSRFVPVPIQEQIVLSTSDGDVFAIFESSNHLAGIYARSPGLKCEVRVKMNMKSGIITYLTRDEIKEILVGTNRLIRVHYLVKLVNYNHSQH